MLMTVLLTVCFCSVAVCDERPPVDGRWGGGGLRSTTPIPARPAVAVEGNTVSIYLQDALSNLNVYIMDNNGIVFETVVSSNGSSNYTYDLPWTGQPGEYQILMVHGMYGHMGGHFTIE